MTTNKVGFWYSDREPHFPKPVISDKKYIDGFVDKCKHWNELKIKAITYDDDPIWPPGSFLIDDRVVMYFGCSKCRICEEDNGDTTYKYHGYEFPNGLFHYILVHGVDIPHDFQEMIVTNSVLDSSTLKRMTRKENIERIMKGFCMTHFPIQ